MTKEEDPYEAVASFIRQNISSIGQLEVLLHLYQTRPAGFTPEKLGQVLATNRELSFRHLNQLCDKGLLSVRSEEKEKEFFFSDVGIRDARILKNLKALYSTHRYRIIDLIYSPKADSIREFAEAFRIRKN